MNNDEYIVVCTNLCDKNAILIKPWLDNGLIERFGVEFVTWASLYWVCQVPNNHIIALFSPFKLSPAPLIPIVM